MNVMQLLEFLVPDREACLKAAAALAAEHPGESPDALARRVVSEAQRTAAAAGGATGLFSSPVTMLPAALADIAAVLRIEGGMAGTIAALLDPGSLEAEDRFRGDVLTVVFPAAVSQAMRQLGIHAGQQITAALVRKYVSERMVESASRMAAKYLMVHLSERAIASKTVPLVGAGIGAGWNYLELRAVGARAVRYYRHEPIAPSMQRVRSLLRRLPWRKSGSGQAEPAS